MARITVEDCLEHVENRFALIHGAIKRVRQLKKGASPLVDSPDEKLTVVALREIAQEKIKIIDKNKDSLPPETETP